MPTRPLGSTGLQVSPVGLGLAALGRPAYIDLGRDADLGDDRGVEALERRCHQVLDAAFAAGVRYLDAARSYGRAEAFLASWLRARGLDPAEVTVGSKWGYTYVGDWRMDAEVHEVKDHSLAALARQVTREPGAARPTTSTCTRSTRPPSTAACSPTGRCWTSWPGCATTGW